MSTWTRVAALALAGTLPAGLAACGGDPEPILASKSPTPSTSSSAPTPSPTETEPEPPKNATAEEAVRSFIEARNHFIETGEGEAFEQLSDSDCGPCQEYVEQVTGLYANGGRVRGTVWDITRIEVYKPIGLTQKGGALKVTINSSKGRMQTSPNGPTQTMDAAKGAYWLFTMRHGSQGWLMHEYSPLGQ